MGNLVIRMVGEGGATHYRRQQDYPFDLKELPDKEGKVLNVQVFSSDQRVFIGLAGAPAEAVKPI